MEKIFQFENFSQAVAFTDLLIGTENVYKIYVESLRGADYLRCILFEAQMIVNAALAASPQ